MSDIWSLSFLYKFIKFGIVGFSGLFVDFGFTYICKEILKIQKYVSNAIGFTLAASSNYYLNRVWTFKSTDPEIFVEYSEFIIISLIGLGINTLILWIIITKYKLNFYLSKVFAIAVVTVWNFLANAFITFS
ncbi:MAG: GtrA family protein [Bacteroidetes bacterium]|jgi:putative flippase GtrA|nr:GtrA family protein [Bacteroidota bacterium]MCK4289078.1 GtrA family protein [Bacteroidales bacterium]MCK4360127.1 GtrA family protein [Bacteroidales bacterium]MCK4406816.1 GtrA family protein [Bacteroidales bacterium]MCK4638378.1 GtrA family protein [Bacteroidales bacterium]